jgi:tRNA-specific 2-thiouridylase
MADRILVGLSGGVDSSVTAATLQQQGYDVTGVSLWLMQGGGQCCSEGIVDAAAICEQLGIAHHVVDTRELFREHVIDPLVSGYSTGITPLPCAQCNRSVKFGPMLRYARETLGIERIATGHYARIRYDAGRDHYQLLRAVDQHKDQSYFLYGLQQEQLAAIAFPLGEQTKGQTRQIAAQLGLRTADKPDSQDLCVADSYGSMQEFLDEYIAPVEGDIVDTAGNVLGKHQGVHHFTIGQRRGLGIAAGERLYVTALDASANQVVVGNRQHATSTECTASGFNWVSMPEPSAPLRAQVQVRSRMAPAPVTAVPLGEGRMRLLFDEPEFSITPGQAAVLYDGDCLLGGGTIERSPPSAGG